jgi:DNA repair protein RadC
MTIKIKELPSSERPYEKLEMYGAEVLSNAELLAIIIKTGTRKETSITLAQKILKLGEKSNKEDLRFLNDISINEFMSINGIGKVKAIQLKAICELTKRISKPINKTKIKIKNTKDVADLLIDELRYEKKEIAKVIILNNKNIIQKIVNISLGSTNFACIEPREVLTDAIKMQAPKIILVHNHPSGDPKPSKEDFRITDRIYECTSLMGIELLDHVIIGDGTYESILFNRRER